MWEKLQNKGKIPTNRKFIGNVKEKSKLRFKNIH